MGQIVRFTPEEDQVIIRMRASGASLATIATALGRHEGSIKSASVRLKIDDQPRASSNFTKPQYRSQPRDRRCLCCGREFRSEGPHNRMCGPCRHRDVAPSPY